MRVILYVGLYHMLSRCCIGQLCTTRRLLIENLSVVWKHLFFSDINECADGAHLCDQVCTNTDGAYRCSCLQGYQLSLDGKTCDGK